MAGSGLDHKKGRPSRRRKRGEAGEGGLPSSVGAGLEAAWQYVADHREAGPYREILSADLWVYGRDILMSWIYDGSIFDRCRLRGIGIHYSDWAWRELRDSFDEREALALDTLILAIDGSEVEAGTEVAAGDETETTGSPQARQWEGFFERSLPGWDPQQAALRTYFVGSLMYPFATKYREWRKANDRWRAELGSRTRTVSELVDQMITSRVLPDNDPMQLIIRRDRLRAILKDADVVNRHIADLVMCGYSYREIAEKLDLTERAVEGRLYRLRRKSTPVSPVQLEDR
jgi:hypothetical protein